MTRCRQRVTKCHSVTQQVLREKYIMHVHQMASSKILLPCKSQFFNYKRIYRLLVCPFPLLIGLSFSRSLLGCLYKADLNLCGGGGHSCDRTTCRMHSDDTCYIHPSVERRVRGRYQHKAPYRKIIVLPPTVAPSSPACSAVPWTVGEMPRVEPVLSEARLAVVRNTCRHSRHYSPMHGGFLRSPLNSRLADNAFRLLYTTITHTHGPP